MSPSAQARSPFAAGLRRRSSPRWLNAIVIAIHRDWAPRGADRFRELVESGYYDDARFFRVE